MFGDKHLKFISWYIELDLENPWIWEDDFVKSHMNELPWIEMERKIFLTATESTPIAEIASKDQNPREDKILHVSIPNTDDS
jgi:hypothetical protein